MRTIYKIKNSCFKFPISIGSVLKIACFYFKRILQFSSGKFYNVANQVFRKIVELINYKYRTITVLERLISHFIIFHQHNL